MQPKTIMLGALLLAGQVLPADQAVTGQVIRVISGDTLTVLDIRQRDFTEREVADMWGVGVAVNLNPPPEKVPTVVHLAEIDAPERNQPYGAEARQTFKLLDRVVASHSGCFPTFQKVGMNSG